MQCSALFISHTLAPLLAEVRTWASLTLAFDALVPLIAATLPTFLSLGEQKWVGGITRRAGSRACQPDCQQQCVCRVFHTMGTTLITPGGVVTVIIVPIAALAIAALGKHDTRELIEPRV